MAKLNSKALGLSLGVIWGAAAFLLGVTAMYGYGVEFVEFVGNLYVGYEATWAGAFIGLVYAFLDGFIGGLLVGWLYNKFNK
jgi:hypothetical protein